MTHAWSSPTTAEAAARRAGGRRRYNAERQRSQAERRARVAELMRQNRCAATLDHGARVAAARELGVSLKTIGEDVRAIRADTDYRGGCCAEHGRAYRSRLNAQERIAAMERAQTAGLAASLGRVLSPDAVRRVIESGS